MDKLTATKEWEQELREYEFKFIWNQINQYTTQKKLEIGCIFTYEKDYYVVTKIDGGTLHFKKIIKQEYHTSWEPNVLNIHGAYVYKYSKDNVDPSGEFIMPLRVFYVCASARGYDVYNKNEYEIMVIEQLYKYCAHELKRKYNV